MPLVDGHFLSTICETMCVCVCVCVCVCGVFCVCVCVRARALACILECFVEEVAGGKGLWPVGLVSP